MISGSVTCARASAIAKQELCVVVTGKGGPVCREWQVCTGNGRGSFMPSFWAWLGFTSAILWTPCAWLQGFNSQSQSAMNMSNMQTTLKVDFEFPLLVPNSYERNSYNLAVCHRELFHREAACLGVREWPQCSSLPEGKSCRTGLSRL